MEAYNYYPVLKINLEGIYHKSKVVVDMYRKKEISLDSKHGIVP
ncbi:hypothetical protein [Aminipila sp.]|nr:hypothetical protein [Aminipila sp.]